MRRWYNGSSSTGATTHNTPALPSGVGASDEANFFYDAQSLPTGAPSFTRGASNGRLVAATYGTGSSAGDYSGYDSAGRDVLKIQQTGSVNYQVSVTLNTAGSPTAMVYPSGHTVNYSYDVAARTSSVIGNLGDGASRNYATDMSYSVLGGLAKEKFGAVSPVYHKLHYNIRGQLYDVRASNVNDEWGGELGAIANYYSNNWIHGGSGTDNNGNVLMSQTIINSFYAEDRYSYDALNRLTAVSEYQNGTTLSGTQQFGYDRWGNRTITSSSWVNGKQLTINPANNRLGVPSGQSGVMSYDAAGNLTNDTYTGAGNRTYDAENKITSAWGGNNRAQLYGYDANGQRIKRTIDGVQTWQVYGLSGELVAEYAASGAPASPQKEYGYRNGQLLVTAEPAGGQSTQNVNWTNAVGVSINGNNLTKTSTGDTWGNAGASSSQAISSGDGYVEFTASELSSYRMIGLSNGDANQSYQELDFAFYLGMNGYLFIYENGSNVNWPGYYATGDTLRVSVESSVVEYRKNGAVVYTSTVTPTYPLVVDTSLYTASCTINNVVISGNLGGGSSTVRWLVSDHLGTPRMIIDHTGTSANVKRHDYLPFGEELLAGTGGRTSALGYTSGDGVRQQFTQKERDIETGLDYFEARYFSSVQGRFTSVDPVFFQKEMLIDPQRYNGYSYVRNNPLKFIDPKGEAIELMGDEEHRRKTLEQLRKAVGKEAGAYLYENKGKDGKYYVGIYTNGPDGKGKAFGEINSLAQGIGAIIGDSRVARVDFVSDGTKVQGYRANEKVTITEKDTHWVDPQAGITFVSGYGETTTFFLDPDAKYPHIPGLLMEDYKGAWDVAASDVLAHEMGEVAAEWGLMVGDANHISVAFENEARRLRDPNAKLRTGHSAPNDARSNNWKLVIKIP